MESGAVEIDGLRVAYRWAGDGPTLLLLHGILSDGRAWSHQLEGLADRFKLVAWDAPGAGESSDPPEDFGIEGFSRCLDSFMEELGIDRAHMLGLSWGGVLAQELCRRCPGRVRSLVLADTYAGWRGSLPAEVCDVRLAGCMRESELPAERWVRDWLPELLTDSASEDLRDEIVGVMSDFHPVGYRAMALSLAESDTRDLLPRIHVPTLLLWGEADRRAPLSVARQLNHAIPGSKLAVIPGAGHTSNLEQPARFNAAVAEFCGALG